MTTVATDYKCSKCGATNCRLWRQYQTFADQIELLCCNCAEQDQGKKCELPGGSDQIGWLVPAVPAGGGTFWGYTSVPDDGVKWWNDLPLRPS